jgi:transcriptional regulator with GAF, ATPase, and Fis domain
MKSLRLSLWNKIFTHDIDFYNRYLWDKMEDFSTLLLGETGTGKGTAALALGRSGFIPLDKRKKTFEKSFTRSFVSLNLSQFPETLIESALFGHKKGAFTGAIENYEGVFDRCSPYGSILLDEIDEISKPIQI